MSGRGMIRRLLLLAVVLAVVGGAAFWFLTAPRTLSAAELPAHEPDLAHGEFLFKIGGCAPCHAAGNITDGRERVESREMAGGWPIVSPFGTFYTPNISPDPEHGIGRWSTLDFVNAMKLGVDPEGRHLYPAFPYYSYQRMPVTDLIDLKAYLDTLPPVATSPAAHAVGFPFNVRRGIGLWKALYIDGEDFQHDPAVSDAINRGAYLVRGPGHCGECHTPRNLLMGPVEARALSGGPPLEQGVRAPNLTPDVETGLGKYDDGDFLFNLMMLGAGLDGGDPPGRGGMRSVLIELQSLPTADQEAIWAYLKSVPPIFSPQEPEPEPEEEQGEQQGVAAN